MHQRFDSIAKVSRLQVPVLFIHGQRDQVISYTMSERNYAATPQPKRLLLIAGGDHATNAVEEATSTWRDFAPSPTRCCRGESLYNNWNPWIVLPYNG